MAKHTWDEGEVIQPATYASAGTMLHTCVCGQAKHETIEKLSTEWLKSASVTASNDLSYNVYARLPDGATDVHLVFIFDGKEIEVEGVLQADGRIKYTFDGVLPQQMGMTITAIMEVTVDGNTWIDTHSESIESYAKKILGNESLKNWRDLMKALLHYGAATQVVAGQTEGFVIEDIADMTPVDRTNIDAIYVNGDADIWTSATLLLDNTITLKIGVNAPAGVERVIYMLGSKTIVTAIRNGYIYIPVSAAEMLHEIVLRCYDGMVATSDPELRISAVYYLTIAISDDAAVNALLDATTNYAVYAAEACKY